MYGSGGGTQRVESLGKRLTPDEVFELRLASLLGRTREELRESMTATEFTVWNDDKIVFTEKGKYNLSAKAPIMIGAAGKYTADVKSFTVRSLK